MPLESITCTSCGATDVQEVKADTYFCNHCEGVFRYARPRGSGGPAVCEIDGCGVAAVGRCLSCGKTICTTHQAKRAICSPLMSMVEPVDCCIECEDQQRIAKERAAEAACRDSETAVCRCCGSRFRPTPELRPTGPGGTGYDPLANWSRDHRKPPQLPQQYRIMALKVTSIGLTGADSFAVTLPTGICEACASEGVAQLETIVSAEYAGLL